MLLGLIIIPIGSVPELQVGGNVNSRTNKVPKNAEECRSKKYKSWMDGNRKFISIFWLTKR